MSITDGSGGDLTLPGTEPIRPPSASIAEGTVIGRYVVLTRVGMGGMGVVYAAYDPQLDRKVALKLLHPEPGGAPSLQRRTRLVREAQALAKLSHPNVVAVYDAGSMDERVWVAMEFVKGRTLNAWLEERPRPWPEVVRVMTAAGEGLAASHDAGLLHRDFKLDNVMIDATERVRVMDFGLARAGDPAKVGRTITGLTRREEPGPLSQDVTHDGALMGTPGYMAPEQYSGLPADHRSDQFSLCVALWEALYGRRPFTGEDMAELVGRVLDGKPTPPPADARVPAWLRRICERGLATDPEDRFESTRALLDALAQGRIRTRRRKWLLGAAVLGLSGAGLVVWWSWQRGRRQAACEAEGDAIAEVWNAEATARLREGLLGSGVGHAETTVDKVIDALDQRAREWREYRVEACTRATVDDQWGAETLDEARWCLDEREAGLGSMVDVLSEADASTAGHAVEAVTALRSSASCLDPQSLERSPRPPAPEHRARTASLRERLARAEALERAGRYDEAWEVLEGLRDEVEQVEWPPLTARAGDLESTLLSKRGALDEAERVAVATYFTAAEARAWRQAALMANSLITMVDRDGSRPEQGRLWAEHAKMARVHAGDPRGLLEANRMYNLAAIAFRTGELPRARTMYEEARARYEAAFGPTHISVGRLLLNLGAVDWSLGSTDSARESFERALTVLEDALGPEHPDIAIVLGNLAALHFEAEAFEEARALQERAFSILDEALPSEHPNVAMALGDLAVTVGRLGDHERALALQQDSIRRLEQAHGPQHPILAINWNNLAELHLDRQRPDEALAAYERAIAIYDQHPGNQQYELESRFGLARLLATTGTDIARARRLAEAARDGYRELGEGKAEPLAEVEAWLATLPVPSD